MRVTPTMGARMGAAADDELITYVDGGTFDPNVVFTDPDTGTMQTQDGGRVFTDGSVQRSDGSLVLPNGNIVYMNGTMRLPDGTLVQGAKDDPSAMSSILDAIRTGAQVTSTVLGVMSRINGNGYVLQPGYTLLSGNRVQLPDGSVVSATRLADGRMQLPNGQIVGPSSSGLFGGMGLLILLGGGALLLLSTRRG